MRPMAVAGPPGMGFYLEDPDALKAQVDGFLERAKPRDVTGDIVALMVPHAGHEYSGLVAAYAYKLLQGKPYSTVILIGNSHRTPFQGAALSDDDAWETPLGPVEVDRAGTDQLAACGPPFVKSRAAHAQEHSLEVQLPFLKEVLPGAKIVPILLCEASEDVRRKVADALVPLLRRPEVLLIASSDMSHFPSYEGAQQSDSAMLEAIATLDVARIARADDRLMGSGIRGLECTLCGLDAVETAIMAAKQVDVNQAVVLRRASSADTAPETKNQCVGYGAVAFTAPQGARGKAGPGAKAETPTGESTLTREEKVRLLKVARQALEACCGRGKEPSLDPQGSAALARKTACFVTLKIGGRLRGCIGELEAREPLIEAVRHKAESAALEDPRFMPVSAREVPALSIEISAMSPLRKVASPDEIVVGKHGVVVRQGLQSGVFLPQVAPEQGWDRDTMLTILCTEKAGLPGDAWRKGADLWVFTADVFGEEELGLRP
jgi:MEMO1 family protein